MVLVQQLNEAFQVTKAQFKKKDGTYCPVVYIDPNSSENTYPVRDKLKPIIDKYGGKYFAPQQVWLWFLPKDESRWEEFINKWIRPCIQELNTTVTRDEAPMSVEDVVAMIDDILAAPIETRDRLNSLHRPVMDEQELKEKLENLKIELMTKLDSKDFLDYIKKVQQFSARNEFDYSFLNSLLIMIQDPQATIVRNKKCWRDVFHRQVQEDAPAIFLRMPKGGHPLYPNKAAKDAFTQKYLKEAGVEDVSQLTSDQSDYLYHELDRTIGKTGFRFEPFWFDVRFTDPIPGMEEVPLPAEPEVEDVAWAEKRSASETETSVKLVDAISQVIEESGLKLEVARSLGGALGACVSNGTIKTLANSKKNISLVQTLIHEFGHALLHQEFLSTHNKEMAEYYNKITSKEVKEQQAEVLAYIVLGYFGVNATLSTAVYTKNWGLTAKTAVGLFDSLCKVSSFVYRKMKAVLDTMDDKTTRLTESLLKEVHMLTGGELADMLGMGELYRQGEDYIEGNDNDPENALRVMKENFQRFIRHKRN